MDTTLQIYHIEYGKRHRIDSGLVARNAMLSEAALLEQQVHRGVMKIKTARQIFVEMYPKTNTVACICKKNSCRMICKMSVLSLIVDKPPKNRQRRKK